MISDAKILKAFIDHLTDHIKTIPNAPVIIADKGKKPSGAYLFDSILPGKNNSYGLARGETQKGVYQIDVGTPVSDTRWANIRLTDNIKVAFQRDLKLESDGQIVEIKGNQSSPIFTDGSHLVCYISIHYIVLK